MANWQKYQRKGEIEARPFEPDDAYSKHISFSEADRARFTFEGGMIARNPANHADQWYINPEFFADHYKQLETTVTDETIEQEIQAKGLTAPRVTPQMLEDVIAGEFYFTALDGLLEAGKREQVIVSSDHLKALGLLTFCVLVLKNGFTVAGESACASPENFNAEIGRKIAREHAKQKLWPLLGYHLKQELYAASMLEPIGEGPSGVIG